MSFFGNLFGPKAEPVPALPPELTPPPSYAPPAGAAPFMQMQDAKGRQIQIAREEWRTKVLPANFFKVWQQPDELACLIESVLQDGFAVDCIEPVRRLVHIDPQSMRSAVFHGVVLLLAGRFEEAAQIIAESIRVHGDDAVLLTNLARAQHGLGDLVTAEQTGWKAVTRDPNYDFGARWYAGLAREKEGEAGEMAAWQRMTTLSRAWSPQLTLASSALRSGETQPAVNLYRQAISRAPQPIPVDLLTRMSGELGQAGCLQELVQLTTPLFSAPVHGPEVGNNLIKAHLDLGQLEDAQEVLDQLRAHRQPGWDGHIDYWTNALNVARARMR